MIRSVVVVRTLVNPIMSCRAMKTAMDEKINAVVNSVPLNSKDLKFMYAISVRQMIAEPKKT